ncbi:hypothetical protein BT69DRAFT_1294229 [Atractiella rhizophila]|nr:hypothetical protein BT69DRAFT_1294229 [Atractiella rhizophila]
MVDRARRDLVCCGLYPFLFGSLGYLRMARKRNGVKRNATMIKWRPFRVAVFLDFFLFLRAVFRVRSFLRFFLGFFSQIILGQMLGIPQGGGPYGMELSARRQKDRKNGLLPITAVPHRLRLLLLPLLLLLGLPLLSLLLLERDCRVEGDLLSSVYYHARDGMKHSDVNIDYVNVRVVLAVGVGLGVVVVVVVVKGGGYGGVMNGGRGKGSVYWRGGQMKGSVVPYGYGGGGVRDGGAGSKGGVLVVCWRGRLEEREEGEGQSCVEY